VLGSISLLDTCRNATMQQEMKETKKKLVEAMRLEKKKFEAHLVSV
jgi:hypothetical protein